MATRNRSLGSLVKVSYQLHSINKRKKYLTWCPTDKREGKADSHRAHRSAVGEIFFASGGWVHKYHELRLPWDSIEESG